MDGGHCDPARIGPNAILQLVPVLDSALGERARKGLFAEAGVTLPPPDAKMLPEAEVIRLHRALCFWLPSLAADLLRQAGLATGTYLLAHRIPRPAQRLIRSLPAPIAARVLASAINRHAWTFAGSGAFAVERFGPPTVSIRRNPLAVPAPGYPGCTWHAAVFERLFGALAWPRLRVVETACCARGHPACRFEIRREV